MEHDERHVRVASGVSLRALTWRPADAATPPAFLLVHGLASNARLWCGVAECLAAAGHVAVAVDQRGHGGSDRDPDGRYELATLTDDLLAVATALGLDRPVVAGQSFGGNVALELGRRTPDAVRGVVAVDGGVIDLQRRFDGWEACRGALTPPPLAGTPWAELADAIRRRHPRWSAAAVAAQLANFALRPDGTVEPHLGLEDHLTILRRLWEHRPHVYLGEVRVPVLLLPVAPTDDGASAAKRAEVEAAAALLPDVRVRWLEGDHDVHAEDPDAVAGELLASAAAWTRPGAEVAR